MFLKMISKTEYRLSRVSCKEDTLFVYRRIGGEAILPCTNLESPVCSSVSWKLYKGGHVTYTTEVNKGEVNKDSDKSSRMSLTSNCSLNLRDLKFKDAGNYICMLHEQCTTNVYLSILAITTSSSISDLQPGGNLSLNCILLSYYDAGSCKAYSKVFTLSWTAEDGSQLTDNSRATDQNRCNVTLVTELQREDNMRRWKCQVNTTESSPAAFLDFTSIFLLEQLPPTTQNQTSVAPAVECPIHLPISRIMLCVALPLMVIVVGVFTRRPNHQSAKRSAAGIELRVLN
ncbi:Hypothetical predicted protein [Scomber scombrus]|uniref:Ig-like domain-containing protein n=1 Tax=Scomber scombrus TaxID=13677 RepID=A0AAV1QDS0_SCOSC